MQLIAGLSKPTSGSIYVQRYGDDDQQIKSPEPLQPERVGIVFQFPERYSFIDCVFHVLLGCSLRYSAILILRFIINSMHFHLLFLLKRQKLLQLSIYSRCRLYESSALRLSKHYFVYLSILVLLHVLGRNMKFKQFFLVPTTVYLTWFVCFTVLQILCCGHCSWWSYIWVAKTKGWPTIKRASCF